MLALTILSAGTATAAVMFGTDGRDELSGTNEGDVVYGRGGFDSIEGCGGDGVPFGGGGDDFLQATATDRPGSDAVVVDPGGIDVVASDCASVFVRTDQGDIGM
jgi:Ca2+-binding RTX toxin-like protein